MNNKDEEENEDKYMLDTNTDYSTKKINAATWVMIAWIILFCIAGSIAVGLSIWYGVR